MLKIYEKDVKPAEKKLLQSCNKNQFKSISIKYENFKYKKIN
jgi:hypothetical protein